MTRRYLSLPVRQNAWRIFESTHEPWQHRAACRGDESSSWFVNPNLLPYAERTRLALTCRDCPVWEQCWSAAEREQATGVNRAGTWWRNSYMAHGRPLIESWAEMWLDEHRLPSSLFRTINDEDIG